MTANRDFLLLTMAKAADAVDEIVEDLSFATADLRLDDPACVSAFARIDALMPSWHSLRLIVAGLPATTRAGRAARRRLLGPDEPEGIAHSQRSLPPAIVNRIRGSISGRHVGPLRGVQPARRRRVPALAPVAAACLG